jgi:hypothetical protein
MLNILCWDYSCALFSGCPFRSFVPEWDIPVEDSPNEISAKQAEEENNEEKELIEKEGGKRRKTFWQVNWLPF